MKKPATVKAVLASQNSSILQDKRTVSNIASPTYKSNLFGYPSLGEPYREAHRMAMLLDSMVSGIDCYIIVFNALKRKYGSDFVTEFYKEVHR